MADDDEFERQSRRSLVIRILAVLAIVALPLGGYIGFRIAQAVSPDPSLAAFDRVFQITDKSKTFQSLGDFAGQGLLITDSRYLTTLGDAKLYGGLGVQRANDGSIVSIVCLAVEPTQTTGSVTCVPRSDFLRVGIHAGGASSGRDDGAQTYTWGPTGAPTRG